MIDLEEEGTLVLVVDRWWVQPKQEERRIGEEGGEDDEIFCREREKEKYGREKEKYASFAMFVY